MDMDVFLLSLFSFSVFLFSLSFPSFSLFLLSFFFLRFSFLYHVPFRSSPCSNSHGRHPLLLLCSNQPQWESFSHFFHHLFFFSPFLPLYCKLSPSPIASFAATMVGATTLLYLGTLSPVSSLFFSPISNSPVAMADDEVNIFVEQPYFPSPYSRIAMTDGLQALSPFSPFSYKRLSVRF